MAKASKTGRDTRFQPGVSGNPKGRPRKPSADTRIRKTLTRLLDEVVGSRDGKSVTAFEAMALRVRKTVLERGKPKDFKDWLELCREYGLLLPQSGQEQKYGVLVVRQPIEDDAEWERRYGQAALGLTGSPPSSDPL